MATWLGTAAAWAVFAGASATLAAEATQDAAYPGNLLLKVDVTDIERRVFNVREVIPVKPGPLTLLYPQWIPGNHAPHGPIDGLAGLVITASGHRIEWVRDLADVYAFHVEVPTGATKLELEFQFASPVNKDQDREMVTPEIVGLQWNTVVLYPSGPPVSRIPVVPSLTLPEGWDFGSALDVESRHGGTVQFKRTTVETLVDSPVFAGKYFRQLDLDPGGRAPVRLDIVADAPASLEIRPDQIAAHRKLVQEAYALFGSHHYDHYDMLLALSDHFGEIGLEHHRSSENRRPTSYFNDWDHQAAPRDLLPHELTHSWNGKFRRPAGLATPNFNVPMQDGLLWVYEGLTEYFGIVLSARSGLWSPDFTRDSIAQTAANMDRNRSGRTWRNLQDTTNQPIITPRRPLSWVSWQRSEDYYPEGELLWLDVDTKLRELSGDQRSLDDFARSFYGVDDGSLGPLPYTFEDIVKALNSVEAFDWKGFLEERLRGHGPGAPLDGVGRGGWKLVYTDTPSEYLKQREDMRRVADFTYSLGLSVSLRDAGHLTEVRWGGPAYEVGLTSGTTLIAVNGREYRPERLKEAIAAARTMHTPIELIVKDLDRFRVVKIPYYDGLKYPRLERVEKTEDRLSAILKPRT